MPRGERGRVVAFMVLCGLVTAGARADVTQTLDSVDAVSAKRVLEMRFGDQPRPGPNDPGYESVDAAYLTRPAESFLACQRAANRDLYCLLNSYTGPDGRLTQPLRRVGAKGEGRFEPVSWDEALADIAQRLSAIAASSDGPQAILPYSYAGTMGLLQGSSVDRRFCAQVFRTDPTELDHIHEVAMSLLDAAARHGGAYDGWTAVPTRG